MAWAAGSRPLSAEASERIVGGLAARSAAPDLLAEERFEMRPEPSPRPVLQEAPRLEHTDAHFQGSASAALFQRYYYSLFKAFPLSPLTEKRIHV